MSRSDLSDLYIAYLDSINNKTIDTDLPRFCHETPVYNGRRLSRSDYQANIDAAFEHMPDARFNLEFLSIDAGEKSIAARIAISGTLVKSWPELGFEPAAGEAEKEKIRFHEHVFYELKLGKIDTVWTLIQTGDGKVIQP
jgi:predicted ester cyclase